MGTVDIWIDGPNTGPAPFYIWLVISLKGFEEYDYIGFYLDWGDGTSLRYDKIDIGIRGGSFTWRKDHTYREEGTYTIKAYVYDIETGEILATDSTTVYVIPKPPPTPELTVTLYLPEETYAFVALTKIQIQVSGGSPPYYVTIDWGDGETSTPTYYAEVLATQKHVFKKTGLLTVRVTVIDSQGNTASDSGQILVKEYVEELVISQFYGVPSEGEAPLEVTFLVEWYYGKEPYTVVIDFGDGTSDDQSGITGTNRFTTKHTYTSPGTYTAKATVSDSAGYVKTATYTITVLAPPPPPEEYRVCMEISEGKGTLCVDQHCTPSYTCTSIQAGKTVTVKATPDQGYELRYVIVSSAEGTRTYYRQQFQITISSDTDIYAYFKPKTGRYKIGVNVKSVGVPPLTIRGSTRCLDYQWKQDFMLEADQPGVYEVGTYDLIAGFRYAVEAEAIDARGQRARASKTFTA